MDSLLVYIVEKWKESFAGISALEIAEEFNIHHDEVIKKLNVLKQSGLVSLNETQLSQPSSYKKIEVNKEFSIRIPENYEMVDTVIVFPSKHILEKVFSEDGKDYGVFANRLHKGDSQIKHYFFKEEVLDKYLKYKDRYHLEDSVTGGFIASRDSYYFSLPHDIRDDETVGQIRYGKFKVKGGTSGIGVIVKDLDYLSYNEQLYWASFEIPAPEFAKENNDWQGYIRANFYGDWNVSHYDPISALKETLEKINNQFNLHLFNKTENPNLYLPVVNTLNVYLGAHKELFKLISPDNLNGNILKGWLESLGVHNKDFFYSNDGAMGREKGKWTLLKLLAEKKCIEFKKFEKIHTERQRDAHHINEQSLPKSNYPELFKRELEDLITELRKLI